MKLVALAWPAALAGAGLLALAAAPALAALSPAAMPTRTQEAKDPFARALAGAEAALAAKQLEKAAALALEAIERDPSSERAWGLRARLALARGDVDEQAFALHRQHALLVAQKAPASRITEIARELETVDPLAKDSFALRASFVKKLAPLAAQLEKDKRPHGAIAIHKRILALDPEQAASNAAIERLSAAPDPSLAGVAKPKDLLAGVDAEWLRKHDLEHSDWQEAAEFERPNYITVTNGGYEVGMRAAEAMEQMSAFYRVFFAHGTPEHGGSVPRIRVHIFKSREEYLKLGKGPPLEWSGGHFTGDSVETYLPAGGGFDDMVGTLFHEAAHQFVDLATQASGWLNEGLASFFEGTRVLPNGSVIMNLPANHRLFPLAARMERGWMKDERDGIDPKDPNVQPETAPTFGIVLENHYEWGPAWYAPTWGVVYFLYNYQDPEDGRFVYRRALRAFLDASGTRTGGSAIANFEEVVLAAPEPPTPGVQIPASRRVALPKTVAELDPVWKQWILALRDEQSGRASPERPLRKWGRYAVQRKEYEVAAEHFEKGLLATPDDPALEFDFAELLAGPLAKPDRATLLLREALASLDAQEAPDKSLVQNADKLLSKLDPQRASLERIEQELFAAARGLVQRYIAAELPLVAMDLSRRMASDLRAPGMNELYAQAAALTEQTPWVWSLAYNEVDLDGWNAVAGSTYVPEGRTLASRAGTFDPANFDYQFLTLDRVTSGDFSLEAEIDARSGQVAFGGLVFGKKSDTNFHALVYFPARVASDGAIGTPYLDLTSFYSADDSKAWQHISLPSKPQTEASSASDWRKLRVDLTGATVDAWLDDQLVVSHEFPNSDVLRGAFGLFSGRGSANYRNVRFLARAASDSTAQADRALRLERSLSTGTLARASHIGRVPPFPRTARWLQGARADWEEKGSVPQLLVLYSIAQEQRVPIAPWVRWLSEQYAASGLEIISIASMVDADAIEAHLAQNPLPGVVGLDLLGESAFGETFEDFDVPATGLPRLVLLDVDQRVAWEGEPGFSAGTGGAAGAPSYLTDPLEQLIAVRRCADYLRWQRAYDAQAEQALERGDFAAALPHLRGAESFDGRIYARAGRATNALETVRGALESAETTAEVLVREQAEPALQVLIEWGELLEAAASKGGKEAPEPKAAPKRPARSTTDKGDQGLDKRVRAALKPTLDSAHAQRWARIATDAPKWATRLSGKKAAEAATEVRAAVSQAPGRFPRELWAELGPLLDAQQHEAAAELLRAAPARPAVWLAREYFRW
jgi:hypothetical protein